MIYAACAFVWIIVGSMSAVAFGSYQKWTNEELMGAFLLGGFFGPLATCGIAALLAGRWFCKLMEDRLDD